MKFIKNNLKVIIGFIMGIILASSITVYAYSYIASDVKYTDEKSVSDALNELYQKINNNLEFGEISFETYKGDRKNITVTKKINSGKYLVAISRTLGGTDSTSFSDEVDEDNSSELICDKNCNIKKLSNKQIYNTSSSKTNNRYTYYNNFLGLYEITVNEDDTTITYNYTISSASTYALGCILETIKLN